MNPQFPIYIVSKGRADSRLTVRALERTKIPYHIIVEAQEFNTYAAVIDREKILVLDPEYQRRYDPCMVLAPDQSRGSGPARNFAWDHAISRGFAWYWCVDDNISSFGRFNRCLKHEIADGTGFRCMEDFCLRYRNVAMAGPNYWMFLPPRAKQNPFTLNTRIYSCNLIRTDIPFRWRCRYNEDTDLSLRILKAGWCTVLFNAFYQVKMPTQAMKGGNTDELYKSGTEEKSRQLLRMHPDVVKLAWRFGRHHHFVNYRLFDKNRLVLRRGIKIMNGADEYGMRKVRKEK